MVENMFAHIVAANGGKHKAGVNEVGYEGGLQSESKY
jgi:hypothetical protein